MAKITYMFDNGATVAFTIFMSVWGKNNYICTIGKKSHYLIGVTTLSIMTFSMMTFSIMKFSRMKFRRMKFSIMTLSRRTQHNNLSGAMTLIITILSITTLIITILR